MGKLGKYSSEVVFVRKTSLWTILISAIILGCLAVLTIWIEEFRNDTLAKIITSFLIVCFASAFISIIAPHLDRIEMQRMDPKNEE